MRQKRNKKEDSSSNDTSTTTDNHMPSWMDESNDHLHKAEAEHLLFETARAAAAAGGDVESSTGMMSRSYGGTRSGSRNNLHLESFHDIDEHHNTEFHDNDDDNPFVVAAATAVVDDDDDETKNDDDDDDDDDTPTKPSSPLFSRSFHWPPNEMSSIFGGKSTTTTAGAAATTTQLLLIPSSKPHMPNQNPCLWMFHFLNGSAVVTSLFIILTQIVPLLINQRSEFADLFSILNLILKCYIVMFCILFILVEMDVPIALLRKSRLLQSFGSRGFLYSFLGLISTVEAYSDAVELYLTGGNQGLSSQQGHPQMVMISWSGIFMQVSAWVLLAIGVVYMLLGMCCLKRVRDRMKEQEQQEWQIYRQRLREWKTRQEILGQDPSITLAA